jgi:Fe-S-cluster containining protein
MSGPFIFPTSYSPWLASRLKGQLPELSATCANCAMVKPTGLTRDKGPFKNNLKCCTYFPFIPNFSLGEINQAKIAQALDRGVLLPVGLFPSVKHQAFVDQMGSKAFGRKQELLCPFFDSPKNQCSIWETRPAVCTTYFCKSDYGQSGLDFWADVEKYLNHFEWQLACEVIFQMGMTTNEIAYCQGVVSEETEEDERESFLQAAWGKWFHRKQEFFVEARKVALTFDSQKIETFLGAEFLELENKISKFSQLIPSLI